MLDIGQDQFLMLLLVIQSELDHRTHLTEPLFVRTANELLHMPIHMRPIPVGLLHSGPRQQAASWPEEARARLDVVRVE